MDIVRTMENKQRVIQAQDYSYTDLLDRHGGSVYKFCRSLTYSKEDADDLFQETFLKAFEQRNKISASDNPQSFLFSTALYLWKSWKRKYARRNRLAPVEPLDESVVVNVKSGFSIEDSIMAQEETRIIRKLVEALPDKYKIPTILYYTVELNVTDIALSLKLPVGTVKSRLFKARKLIEKGLVAYGYEQ